MALALKQQEKLHKFGLFQSSLGPPTPTRLFVTKTTQKGKKVGGKTCQVGSNQGWLDLERLSQARLERS